MKNVWKRIVEWLEEFWRESGRRAWKPLLIITAIVLAAEWRGSFEHLEGSTVDAYTRAATRVAAPKDLSNLLIVEITEDDYREFFGGVSPLNPRRVITLIDAVGRLEPRAIGVDLDTRNPAWACVDLQPIAKLMPKIVWAEVPEEVPEMENAAAKGAEPELTVTTVLGGRSENLQVALARMPGDADGVVRKYRAAFPVNGGIPALKMPWSCEMVPGKGLVPVGGKPEQTQAVPRAMQTLAHALAQYRGDQLPDTKSASDKLETSEYLRFAGDRSAFPVVQARALLEWNGVDESNREPQIRHLAEDKAKMVTGKIVLIGGRYAAARDEYMTALGPMGGVELIGHAMNSELSGKVKESSLLAFALDVVSGSVIVLIYFKLRRRPYLALTACVAAALFLPMAISILFSNVAWFLNFAPITFGMVVHQMYEGTKLAAEHEEKLLATEKELEDVSGELTRAQSDCQLAAAQLLDLQKHVARLESEAGELRAHVRRLGGHVRAKGHHAG